MKQNVSESEVVLLGMTVMMFVNTMEYFKTKIFTICLARPKKSRTQLEFGSSPDSQRSERSLIGSFKRRRPKLAVIFCQHSSRINAELKPEMTEDPDYKWSGVGIVALLGYCVSTLGLVLNFDRMTPILCLTIQLAQRCWNPRRRFRAIFGALKGKNSKEVQTRKSQAKMHLKKWIKPTATAEFILGSASSSATKFPATISTSMSCSSGNWMSRYIHFIFTPNDFKQKGGETPSFHQDIQNSWQENLSYCGLLPFLKFPNEYLESLKLCIRWTWTSESNGTSFPAMAVLALPVQQAYWTYSPVGLGWFREHV